MEDTAHIGMIRSHCLMGAHSKTAGLCFPNCDQECLNWLIFSVLGATKRDAEALYDDDEEPMIGASIPEISKKPLTHVLKWWKLAGQD